jgi:hypothetical protein
MKIEHGPIRQTVDLTLKGLGLTDLEQLVHTVATGMAKTNGLDAPRVLLVELQRAQQRLTPGRVSTGPANIDQGQSDRGPTKVANFVGPTGKPAYSLTEDSASFWNLQNAAD